MSTLRDLARNRALLTFMLGHFTVDMYGGLLPVLYPLMALQFDLTKEAVGLVALAYSGTSSLSQPLFGYLTDRFGSRVLAPASMVWAAVMFAVIGFSPNYGVLVLLACFAGLGSGAYHPLGASNVSLVAGDQQKNTALSVYTAGGTAGYALGPVLGALIFALLGTRGSAAVLPVGLISAVLIGRSLAHLQLASRMAATPAARADEPRQAIQWRALAPVVAVTMLRSWAMLSLVTFIPLWYADMGYSSGFYGALTTLVIAGGAIGTIVGGVLADRLGQRRVLIWSLAVTIPALLLFVGVPGPIALLTGPLFGLLADSSLSITLVMAQRLLPGRVGMASGFILGIGFVTGGIGVPITGKIADHFGTSVALLSLSILLVLALACTPFLQRAEAPQQRDYRPALAGSDDAAA